ncbi:MAG TPA: hypothetical protein VKU01_24665 [Bryobacteraceae bacterium]|nr:hypothetical protein [Bryobacteraceae bacterium]
MKSRTHWWKYDLPCCVEGKVIRPQRSSTVVPYDPWIIYREQQGKYRTVPTLWGEFAELVRRCGKDAIDPYTPSSGGEALILDWTNRYGMLGILPSRLESIVLPEVYRPAPLPGTKSNEIKSSKVQHRHVRVAGHWITETDTQEENRWSAPEAEQPGDDLAPSAQREAREPRQPARCAGFAWEDLTYRAGNTADCLPAFFSARLRSHQYPQPLSQEFWRAYQEPIREWMRAAVVFSEAVKWVSRLCRPSTAGDVGTTGVGTKCQLQPLDTECSGGWRIPVLLFRPFRDSDRTIGLVFVVGDGAHVLSGSGEPATSDCLRIVR